MNPAISDISEDGDVYTFTLKNINVSLANALRRTILSDIPTLVFYTETYADNQCSIEINTTRLHNELLKQRLSCIPIHEKDLDILPGKYVVDVDVKNDTDNMMYVTTKDFKIRNKETGVYAKAEESQRIFPSNPKTNNSYIDFVRLRPKISESIPGEHLKFHAEFSVSTAKVNSTFNVVSKCAYANTIDMIRVNEMWGEYESKLRSEEATADEIEFQKRNFYMLDAQRQFVPDSFDFIIQTLGVFDNKEIIKKACVVIQNKFVDLIGAIESDTIPIISSESSAEPSTIDNCYDITLENEDYTIGKIIEYILYEKRYMGDKSLSYCGFKKFHPHSSDSIIRLAFTEPGDKAVVRQYLREVCVDAQDVFTKIHKMF